jgi:hypothetical protein
VTANEAVNPFSGLGSSGRELLSNKKGRLQANLVRMRKDSHLSEKGRKKQDSISGK